MNEFLDWVRKHAEANDMFKVPRYFLGGGDSWTFNLWRMTELFDSSGKMTKELEAVIEPMKPSTDHKLKEALITVAFSGYHNHPAYRLTNFKASSFLIPHCTIKHQVLRGVGSLTTPNATFTWVQGDSFEPKHQQGDLCKLWLYDTNIHVITCWSASDESPWDTFCGKSKEYYEALEQKVRA